MANLKFGWKAGTEQYPPAELLEYAVAAEQAGFDSIDVSDHFHPWAEKGQACFVWAWRRAEAIELMRKLWTGEKVTHRGVYYQTRQAKLYTLPNESIPIYISAMVP